MLVVLLYVAAHEALRLHYDVFHELVVVIGGHRLLQLLHLGKHVGGPVLLGPVALKYADVEVSELRTREVKVGCAVGIGVGKVGAGPVEHGHEVVAHRVYALERKVPEALLVVVYESVALGPGVLYGLAHGQALHYRPPEAVALDVLAQVAYALARPHFAVRHVVQGGHYALHTYLP